MLKLGLLCPRAGAAGAWADHLQLAGADEWMPCGRGLPLSRVAVVGGRAARLATRLVLVGAAGAWERSRDLALCAVRCLAQSLRGVGLRMSGGRWRIRAARGRLRLWWRPSAARQMLLFTVVPAGGAKITVRRR